MAETVLLLVILQGGQNKAIETGIIWSIADANKLSLMCFEKKGSDQIAANIVLHQAAVQITPKSECLFLKNYSCHLFKLQAVGWRIMWADESCDLCQAEKKINVVKAKLNKFTEWQLFLPKMLFDNDYFFSLLELR